MSRMPLYSLGWEACMFRPVLSFLLALLALHLTAQVIDQRRLHLDAALVQRADNFFDFDFGVLIQELADERRLVDRAVSI